jgi:uncharacterized protein Yka (UPF0111/DUF47 family)
MFALFKKLMPREDKFFDLFEAHAAKAVEASKSLRAVLDGGKGIAAACSTLMKQEAEADIITEEVMQAIRRSFITPFDRGDINNLITAMDDAVDQMNKTAKAVLLFEPSSFEPQMKAMADGAVKLAGLAAQTLPLLRNIGMNSARLHALTAEMVACEDETDRQNEAGLKALLKGKAKKDAMAYIVGSELYEHLEKVADRFEDVAHVISGIAIEHG